MKIIKEKRGEGKTQQLIQWMLEAPVHEIRVLVSVNKRASDMVMNRYCENSKLDKIQFISFEELIKRQKFNRTSVLDKTGMNIAFGIDDIDLSFGEIFPNSRLGAISFTVRDPPTENKMKLNDHHLKSIRSGVERIITKQPGNPIIKDMIDLLDDREEMSKEIDRLKEEIERLKSVLRLRG